MPIDYNGDGRQDLLVPLPAGTLPNQSSTLPAWAILQATGAATGPTFTLVDPKIPFEPLLGSSGITLADPHGPRVGDVNGDGAEDVILPLSGVFNIFQNLAPDQDLLVTVTDGMNAHDPTDPGFTPNVSVSYGHLTDASITSGTAALESYLYISNADTANGCAYPRSCAVGPRRVVSAYATNNGADSPRHFGVRYRDGRYHRLGRGFLGFEERLVTDLDTLAGTASFFDNLTFMSGAQRLSLRGAGAARVALVPRERRTSPSPDQIELSFTDVTPEHLPHEQQRHLFHDPDGARGPARGGRLPRRHSRRRWRRTSQQIAASDGATLLSDTT